jgi:hypothetical protein
MTNIDGDNLQYDDGEKSHGIQDILGAPPNAILRWGIAVTFIVLSFALMLSLLISYPETIKTSIVLTSKSPPVSIIAKNPGILELMVHDEQTVGKGHVLGIIGNSANATDALELLKWFNAQSRTSLNWANFPDDLQLGEVQQFYLNALKEILEYDLFMKLKMHENQIGILKQQMAFNEVMDGHYIKQISIQNEELLLAKKRQIVDSTLFSNRVLAEQDYDKTKSAYLSSQRSFETSLQSLTGNRMQRWDIESEIGAIQMERERQLFTLEGKVLSSLRQLRSQLGIWEENYLLAAPVGGKVVFFKYRNSNQFVKIDEEIMRVMPKSSEPFGEILLPMKGSGKVKLRQKVYIRLDNYPHDEYGMLKGTIEQISRLPKDNLYAIRVKLTNGLISTYNKHIPFGQDMKGSVEIVTKDLTLAQRIFYQLRSLIDKAQS